MGPGDRRLIGVVLDRRYRVDAAIARGGMSSVYRGVDLRLDRPVAVKVMDPAYAHDPQFLARFEFEARAVARLSHPGLVAVHDQGVDDEHAFLVMELVDGGTLRELLRERGPMPPHAATAVVSPVLEALAVAHRAGLVHRDVKPENVLISESGEVKIADFGLVRAVAGSNVTSSSVILGTAAYLSPEQVTAGTADARSDVYATGVLLFEMLTGRTPFTGDTSLAIAYQRISTDVAAPSSLIEGVPAEFDALVLRATARDPANRFRDAGEMAGAVRSAARQLQLPDYRVPAPRRSAQHAGPRGAGLPADPAGPTEIADDPAATAGSSATELVPHPAVEHAGPQPTRVVTAAVPRTASTPGSEGPADDGDVVRRGRDRYEFPDFAADRSRARRTMVVWFAVVVLAMAAVGVAGWWLGSGRYTTVPAVTGMDRAAASAAVVRAGLSPQVRGEYSDTAPVDTLLGTDPDAGSRIRRDGSVAVRSSLGKPAVPALSPGADRARVENDLRSRTFVPADGGEAFSATAPTGSVAALDPAPGTVLPVGSQVRVVRSKGSPPVHLPDLRGKSVDQARAALSALGVTVSATREVFDPAVDGGDVVGTEPSSGTEVGAGSSVTLTVSTAVKVPSMLGRSVGSARDELVRLGLVVEVRQVADSDRSLVLGQTPGAGTRIGPGSSVTLTALP